MPDIDIQQLVTLFLPFAAALLSYALQRAHWSNKTNGIIASLAVIAAGAATTLVEHKLTGNPLADLAYVLAAATALQSHALAPLQRYLQENFPVSSAPMQE